MPLLSFPSFPSHFNQTQGWYLKIKTKYKASIKKIHMLFGILSETSNLTLKQRDGSFSFGDVKFKPSICHINHHFFFFFLTSLN